LGGTIEYNPDGSILREFVDGRFGAYRLTNGNTLIACGDDSRIIEVDPDDNIVWEVTRNDIDGMVLGFIAGLVRLPNGNTLICNWTGHGKGHGPPVFEVTPALEVVWAIDTNHQDLLGKKIVNNVASVKLLDPGCTDTLADNYASLYLFDNGSCTYTGCADSTAENYYCKANPDAAPCLADPEELEKISGEECIPAGIMDKLQNQTPAIHFDHGKSIVHVELSHNPSRFHIFLYGLEGNQIYTGSGAGSGSFHFPLEAGIYYILVKSEDMEYLKQVILF
jgi:hypothetical protein